MIPETELERLARQVCNSTDPQPTAVLHGCTHNDRMYLCGCLAGKGIKIDWKQDGDTMTFWFEKRR